MVIMILTLDIIVTNSFSLYIDAIWIM